MVVVVVAVLRGASPVSMISQVIDDHRRLLVTTLCRQRHGMSGYRQLVRLIDASAYRPLSALQTQEITYFLTV